MLLIAEGMTGGGIGLGVFAGVFAPGVIGGGRGENPREAVESGDSLAEGRGPGGGGGRTGGALLARDGDTPLLSKD